MRDLFARDERERSIDLAGDRIAYLVVSYGLLVVVAVRSVATGDAAWELLGLVILGGLAGAAYRLWHRAWTREAVLVVGLTVAAAAVVAAALALAGR